MVIKKKKKSTRSIMFTKVGEDIIAKLRKGKLNIRQQKSLGRLELIKRQRVTPRIKLRISRIKRIKPVRQNLKLIKIRGRI